MNTATQIACKFSELLRADLSEHSIQAIISHINAPEYEGSCASHDYCDSNVYMAEAFEEITEEEFDAQKQEHADLWNEAWRIAKEKEFTF